MAKWIMQDVLGNPSILVGLFALIGLVLQKRGFVQIMTGTLKTIMGFVILGAGAQVIIGTLDVFGNMFQAAFQLKGVVPNNEAIVAVAQKMFGRETAWIMVFGMLVNLLVARITPFKYVFLTGHHTFYMAAMLSAILSAANVTGAPMVVIGSLLLGLAMVLFPALLQPYVRKITGSDDFAVGHFGSLGYFTAGTIGKWFGDRKVSTEDLKVPKSLGFLRDSSVAVSLTMTVLFLLVALVAGPSYVERSLSDGTNFVVYAIIQGITFAAGVYIILAGVRMLISEIVPAFKGIADKVIPEAKPALDCPTVFPYAPNAVIIGFLSSFGTGLALMFVMPWLGLAVIIPGLVPHFFTGATAGVFGNATGGLRGALLGGMANGLLISFLPALLLPVLGSLGFEATTFGDSDFAFVGIILGNILQLFK
ncbi:PTS ascorbate transporter subunit IIC [Hydrogenibacillus sp. N12]|uniref:PTS ascorbate transporter subunit IIC n=1 Tax=Hydrogenibacillus sp. N12 TaxID=2866627 RepID=UPI001C7D409C|nr:PTS ascorbate transporter subunit IIC [Hydrogenibacillus sp. N12]QZA33685.1 PTS ascorbate transporter subunit IIC [Hydrogenibacillus sp. N12]